jgi:hypothetical protein
MIHYVSLKHRPDDFRVPEPLSERFWYDEDKKCLAHDGAMFKSTFDRIRGLSTDYDFQRAAEDLFRASVPEDDGPQHRGRGVVMATGAVLALAILAAGAFVWQRMNADQPLPPTQTTITDDLAGN